MPEITKLSNLSLELQKQTTPRLNDTKMTRVLFASFLKYDILYTAISIRVNLKPDMTFQKFNRSKPISTNDPFMLCF